MMKIENHLYFTDVPIEELMISVQPFKEMLMYYECALLEVKTKVEVLDKGFEVKYQRNPVQTIKTRLTRPVSIVEKLDRLGLPRTIANMGEHIHDIAGIRIICSFMEDIYTIAELLTGQDDIILLQKKDYIQHPKPNGYRSLHLLVEVPIFLSNQKKSICVEVQLRTVAMDFWASIEHDIKYKKDVSNRNAITERLRLCAERVASLDFEMQEIGREININSEGTVLPTTYRGD